MSSNGGNEELRRANERRAELNRQAREGRNSSDPAERAKWLARDEALTRGFGSPDGKI